MPVASRVAPNDGTSRQVRAFAWAAAALVVCYGGLFVRLARFSFTSEFNSYLGLVPVIAAGLVWWRRKGLRGASEPPNRLAAAALLACGAGALACHWAFARPEGGLSLAVLSFVFFLGGVACWFLGRDRMRVIGFPLAFLVCMVPLPPSYVAGSEYVLQHASASVAFGFLEFSDLPMLRQGDLAFRLPGITLEIAPECSGIQSTLALFVVSLAAGCAFLRSPWKRAVLTLAVLPLGILRNATRIVTIAELCVHIGPQAVNSYIHRSGGWIFFLFTLVPFLVILLLLMRLEGPAPEKIHNLEGIPSCKD
jgi:exosortase C (VPDSG-CTERM-specific)